MSLASCGSGSEPTAVANTPAYLNAAREGFPAEIRAMWEDSALLDFGNGVCESVRQGLDFEDMLAMIAENSDSTDDLKLSEANLTLAALTHLCPELKEQAGVVED